MKAAFIQETGPPSVIQVGDLPDPQPTGRQVLIRTAAVAVNPIDTYIRSGNVKLDLPPQLLEAGLIFARYPSARYARDQSARRAGSAARPQ